MKKIVIKIGRNIATSKRNKIDKFRFEQLAKQIKQLYKHNVGVVLVVSAAVCCGEHELGLKDQYTISGSLVAGVGQTTVMAELYSIFQKHNLKIGQLLLTQSDLDNKKKRTNLQAVISEAIAQKIILIVNENDIVEFNSFAGNDYLAAEIATLVRADNLVLLTDVAGVLNEHRQIIQTYVGTETIAKVTKRNDKGTVGGMTGKITAASKAVSQGVDTWIVSGRIKNLLIRMFLQSEHIGTRVVGEAI
jgi:glutamate 5-kinase